MTRRHRFLDLRRPRIAALVGVFAPAALIAGCATGGTAAPEESDSYPAEDVEWIIPFGPDSGGDIMARTIISIMDKYEMFPHEQVVTNIEGASGSIGYTTLLQREGDENVLSVTSSSFITGPLSADTVWQTTDFTPIALVGRDDYVFVVNKDAGHTDFADFVEAAKTKTAKIGIVSLLTAGFIVGSEIGDAAGYEWDAVPFTENGQMFSALFTGAIDALITNPGEVAGQLEVGDMIGLGVSSEERLEGAVFENIPTFAELGYATTAALPRGVIAAPGMSDQAQDWWANALQEVVATPEWQEFLVQTGTSNTQLFGDDWGDYYRELSKSFEERLREAGAID